VRNLGNLVLVALLSACGHTPVSRTVADAFGDGAPVASVPLNLNLSYLRVVSGGREALMVLGYSDPHPAGPIDTWYSRDGEMIRLQNGRIQATAGLGLDWRSVDYQTLPSWQSMMENSKAEFARVRDEMPGYRFGIRDTVAVYATAPPKEAPLKGIAAADLFWFEETVTGVGSRQRPSARYAVRSGPEGPVVVFGEQCLSPQLCIAWQTWPATPQ
jgi:hypothetical protein